MPSAPVGARKPPAGEKLFLEGTHSRPVVGRHDTILKPTIEWQLQADKAAKLDAELAYVTGGMSWEAERDARPRESPPALSCGCAA